MPSEEGLGVDARAAWEWLVQHGAVQEDILVVGNSLGTGVAVRLVNELEGDRERPRGLVLLAPFSSVDTLMETYRILGFLPLMSPLRVFPYVAGECYFSFSGSVRVSRGIVGMLLTDVVGTDVDFFKRFLIHRFDSLAKITVSLNYTISGFQDPYTHTPGHFFIHSFELVSHTRIYLPSVPFSLLPER